MSQYLPYLSFLGCPHLNVGVDVDDDAPGRWPLRGVSARSSISRIGEPGQWSADDAPPHGTTASDREHTQRLTFANPRREVMA